MFVALLRRGLDPATTQLGIMDGLPGLEDASEGMFRRGKVRRCLLHKAEDVLAKVRKKDRKTVADEIRKAFCAGDAPGAKQALEASTPEWTTMYPDAVKCLAKDFETVTAHLECPELEWIRLRTTNLIERLKKEFKRRTKPMEIVAGENSARTILAFVAMKMEMSWRNASFRNSGFRKLKPFAGHFTHPS